MVIVTFILGCTEPGLPILPPPVQQAGRVDFWTSLTSFPCVAGLGGDVQCWKSDDWHHDVQMQGTYSSPPMKHLSITTYPTVMVRGLDELGRQITVNADEFRADQLCNAQRVNEGPFVAFAGCLGLDDDGRLHDLYFGYAHRESLDLDGPWLDISIDGLALVDPANRIHHTLLELEQPPEQLSTPGIPEDIVVYNDNPILAGCVLDDTGVITCFGLDDPSFAPAFGDDEYLMMSGGNGQLCAVRAHDDRIVCVDGTTFDWGPIRELAAYGYGYVNDEGRYVNTSAGGPMSVCAILRDNTIRCEGRRYPDDIQEALAAVNEANRLELSAW